MTDQIANILAKRSAAEPPEIKIIKTYLNEHFNSTAMVTIGKNQITITVPGASLAGALQMHLFDLKNLLSTDKKLVIRIGQNSI